MFICGLLRIRNDGQCGHHSLQIFSPFRLLRFGSTFHSVPKFRDRDGGDLKLVVGKRGDPASEIESTFFPADDHIGIEDYRHLSAGGASFRRAVFRSRCHALAVSSASSVFARVSARSRPEQLFALSGTKRATGTPFFSSTKVAF